MKKFIALCAVIGLPVVAAASATIKTVIETLLGYLGYIIPALITIAVIYFIWGIVTFISASDEEQKKMSRSKIINGLIGLFIIVSFWGIIGVVKNSFGVDNTLDQGTLPVGVPTPYKY